MGVTFDASYPELLVDLVFPAPIGTVDVTEYWLEGSMFIGRQREADAYDGACSFTLDNWDGRFTPGQPAGTYSSGGVSFVRPRVGVRIRATWSGTTWPLWRGFVTSWLDNWALGGQDTTVTVACAGPASILAAWNGTPVDPAVGEGDSAGQRIARLLDAASAQPYGSTFAAGHTAFAATDLAGNGATLVADVVAAEGGAFWYDPSGAAIFEDRASLLLNTRSNTSQATFSDASLFFRDAVPMSTDDQVYNDISFQRDGGLVQSASDATSQSTYGVRSYRRTGVGALADPYLLGVAEYDLARYKDAGYFIGALSIDPVASASLMWPHALGRQIRDRVSVSASVARNGLTVAGDAFVEGVTHTISQMSWLTTFNLSTAAPWDTTIATPSLWGTGLWDTAEWWY